MVRESWPSAADGLPLDAAVAAYYDLGQERGRLETWGRLEFLRTQELLHRYLPATPARILDVGGGAGIHARPLLSAGHDVTLVDPVSLHVEQAKADGVDNAEVGDARQLRFDDGSFDAVLLLGPLYHLTERSDRVRAVQEARRVVGPSGLIIAAVISRFASTYDGLHRGFLLDNAFDEIVQDDVKTGQHRNPDSQPGWFTTAYFHHPEELHGEFADAGCDVEAVLAIEGPGSYLPDIDGWLDDPARRAVLLGVIRRVESDPTLFGASSHLLIVARPAGDG